MNDTNLNIRQKTILKSFLNKPEQSVSEIAGVVGGDVSLVTIRRDLRSLLDQGMIGQTGQGRSYRYTASLQHKLFFPIDPTEYNQEAIETRGGETSFVVGVFNSMPESFFTQQELGVLGGSTQLYQAQSHDYPTELHHKELQRFIVELSWKSSAIEGNTYTLLDTAFLIEEGLVKEKYTQQETQMILNHKKAFEYIVESRERLQQGLRVSYIEDIHSLLVRELGVQTGLRTRPVGITGSSYVPLDNTYQITDALNELVQAVDMMSDPYSKSLLVLIGISYIQPFADGNKRTARLLANAMLVSQNYAPLSYRDVDVELYREAMLLWYEQQVVTGMKGIFMEQYVFAAKHYRAIVQK